MFPDKNKYQKDKEEKVDEQEDQTVVADKEVEEEESASMDAAA